MFSPVVVFKPSSAGCLFCYEGDIIVIPIMPLCLFSEAEVEIFADAIECVLFQGINMSGRHGFVLKIVKV